MPFLKIKKLDYGKIYNAYKLAPYSDKQALLREADEKFGLDFDPEEILEMIIDEINEKLFDDDELLEVTKSLYLKWHEVAGKLKAAGFSEQAELMVPAIKECGYDTGGLG